MKKDKASSASCSYSWSDSDAPRVTIDAATRRFIVQLIVHLNTSVRKVFFLPIWRVDRSHFRSNFTVRWRFFLLTWLGQLKNERNSKIVRRHSIIYNRWIIVDQRLFATDLFQMISGGIFQSSLKQNIGFSPFRRCFGRYLNDRCRREILFEKNVDRFDWFRRRWGETNGVRRKKISNANRMSLLSRWREAGEKWLRKRRKTGSGRIRWRSLLFHWTLVRLNIETKRTGDQVMIDRDQRTNWRRSAWFDERLLFGFGFVLTMR